MMQAEKHLSVSPKKIIYSRTYLNDVSVSTHLEIEAIGLQQVLDLNHRRCNCELQVKGLCAVSHVSLITVLDGEVVLEGIL